MLPQGYVSLGLENSSKPKHLFLSSVKCSQLNSHTSASYTHAEDFRRLSKHLTAEWIVEWSWGNVMGSLRQMSVQKMFPPAMLNKFSSISDHLITYVRSFQAQAYPSFTNRHLATLLLTTCWPNECKWISVPFHTNGLSMHQLGAVTGSISKKMLATVSACCRVCPQQEIPAIIIIRITTSIVQKMANFHLLESGRQKRLTKKYRTCDVKAGPLGPVRGLRMEQLIFIAGLSIWQVLF